MLWTILANNLMYPCLTLNKMELFQLLLSLNRHYIYFSAIRKGYICLDGWNRQHDTFLIVKLLGTFASSRWLYGFDLLDFFTDLLFFISYLLFSYPFILHPEDCDFENGNCGWKNDPSSFLRWTRRQGVTHNGKGALEGY